MQHLLTNIVKHPNIYLLKNLLKFNNFGKGIAAQLDSFLNGTSGQYIEEMYQIWLKDPSKVHPSWDAYFRLSKDGGVGYTSPPTLGLTKNELAISSARGATSICPFPTTSLAPQAATEAKPRSSPSPQTDIEKHLAVQAIIRGYQVRGHFLADLDPLGVTVGDRTSKNGAQPPDIITSQYKIDEADWDKTFHLPLTTKIGGNEKTLTLREIIKRLERTYCGTIGLEYMFINSVEECDWIRERFEAPGVGNIPNNQKKLTLARLARAELFENFCGRKYSAVKRFGLEGLDSIIPCLKTIIDRSSTLGVDSFVIGMAHRGRLNVLVNVCRKCLVQILGQFEGLTPEDEGSGDVKYHLGVLVDRMNRVTNKHIKIAVIANPSHLESVSPILVGRVRAEHFFAGDTAGKKTLGILLHGDAALNAQGINFEVLNLANLPCYTVHGTIHIVENNQIGFTTDRKVAGSSPYCTDVARVINIPIFHVNADDPEAVVYVSEVASDWRHTFHKDCVIDVVGYRKHGHQEVDDPEFTQPVLYKKIKTLKTCFTKYTEKLIKEKIVTNEEINQIKNDYEKILEADFAKAKQEKTMRLKDWMDSPWHAFFEGKDPKKMLFPTGIHEDTIKHIASMISEPPPESAKFVLHKALQRTLKLRRELADKRLMDYAMAETIAYGSLLKDGIHVRITGEDVERGTFSHRHHVYHHMDIENEIYCPVEHLYPDQAKYTVCNSCLSEYGVMGFEHGYSMVNPHSLVIWEAQFGDFSNTGQPIMDQYISSGETKWGRQCGMVLLLPHGMEGQGPEHSSARPERFLDMLEEDPDIIPPESPDYVIDQLRAINWIVANCSTPANHFHALRRQIALPFRKPLLMFTPKAMLRHPDARSSFDLILPGTEFLRLIPNKGPASNNPKDVKKLIFCTGKIFYEADRVIKEGKLESQIAVSRIEQLGPFPFDLVQKEVQKYPEAKICWLQEEHKNQGYWDHMEPRLRSTLRHVNDCREVNYIGREVSASPATGYSTQYAQQAKKLNSDIIKLT